MFTIDRTILAQLSSRQGPSADHVDALLPHLRIAFARHRIDTPLRAAHCLAQLAHESDGFATLTEYADGEAYEGRVDLGNTQPGDGKRYKGRGLVQLTGRANYRRIGKLCGIDLEAEPGRAADPAIAARTACAYWHDRGINRHADRDDLIAVTFAVNGGLNGLAERRRRLVVAKAGLDGAQTAAPAPMPTLRHGAHGPAVASLQHALQRTDRAVRIDGDFGPATGQALIRFQRANGLTPDGVAGPASWALLVTSHRGSTCQRDPGAPQVRTCRS